MVSPVFGALICRSVVRYHVLNFIVTEYSNVNLNGARLIL